MLGGLFWAAFLDGDVWSPALTLFFYLLQDHIDDKHCPRPANASTAARQQQSQKLYTQKNILHISYKHAYIHCQVL